MRLSVTIGLGLSLLLSLAPQALAQYQNPDWTEVTPAGESFHVSMPYQPRVEVENTGAVSGNRYVALTGLATYTVWSITGANYRAEQDTDRRLDATAELLWDGLLKSAREQLDEKDRRFAGMSYVRELPPEGLPGREYTLTIGAVTGTAQFFLAHERIYVLLAMGKPGEDWPREKFFASFRTASSSAASSAAAESSTKPLENAVTAPVASASGAEDYNRTFTGREVTAKVRILEKPEPTYSESARRFGVQGTVVLRAVFSKDGQVTNIHIVRKLPHGLTQRAVDAARAIRFVPAAKDGQPVSMWMELQYNFNLY
jgi:TonB family protein